MKVVLFCGGLGMRLRPLSASAYGSGSDPDDEVPKPMVHVGSQRPLLWHVMKYYAHFGHKDFVLCLGYKSEYIRDYFLNYNECLTNDFTMSQGGDKIDLISNDIQDWNITFADTGINSNVGQRLLRVKHYLEGEDEFLVNYSDGVCDLSLPDYLDEFHASGKTGAFILVRPPHTTHVVQMNDNGDVSGIQPIRSGNVWINGGYFIFKKEIFDYIEEGDELVEAPFQRLIKANQLFGRKHYGFWTCIDTFKEKQALDEMYAQGNTPWQVWMNDPADSAPDSDA